MLAHLSAVNAHHHQVRRRFDTQYTYKQVFNGLSVTLSGSEAQQNKTVAALKALPQVSAAALKTSCLMHCSALGLAYNNTRATTTSLTDLKLSDNFTEPYSTLLVR